MGDWKNRLSKFISGESTVFSGDNWTTANKTALLTGNYNWILGQTGLCPYKYVINVQVNIPTGYTKETSATEAASLINSNMLKDTHKGVTFLTFWNYNLLFGAQSKDEATAFAEDIKTLSGYSPESATFDWWLVVAGILAAVAIYFALKKR